MRPSRVVRRVACLACFALACGERAPASEADPTGRVSPASAGSTPDPAVLDESLAVVPETLARACIAGDSGEGIPWRLDSVALSGLATETIETLAARDSARLAARIARMVDVIPSDTSVADFRGLPVTVRVAWRIRVAEGDTVVVAIVARRVPIESDPLEELFTIVAAPGQRSGVRDPLVDGWFVREVGPEERLVARELVGAYVRDAEVVLAFVEDTEGGVRAALVTRSAGTWRATWTGSLPSCPVP